MGRIDEQHKAVIGQVEEIIFCELDNLVLHARIDTGAATSAIWVKDVVKTIQGIEVTFPYRDDGERTRKIAFSAYDEVTIKSSSGHRQVRYKIDMLVMLHGKQFYTPFTLADRSSQTYPVLIGRSALQGRYVVDVDVARADEL